MATALQDQPLKIVDLVNNVPSAFDVAREHGFRSATSAYMQAVVDLLTNFMGSSQGLAKTESDLQKNFTQIAEDTQKQVQAQWKEYYKEKKEADSSSGFGAIFSYIVSALVGLIAVVTADPALFAMVAIQVTMQASGGEKKLEAVLPKSMGLKVLCELGIAVGEAALCGGIGAAAEKWAGKGAEAAAEGGADAASSAVKTSSQKLAASVKNGAALLSQTLMMTPFWADAFKAMGVPDKDAEFIGMAVGFATALGASYYAAKEGLNGSVSEKIQQMFSKVSSDPQLLQARLMAGLSILAAIFEAAAGGEQIQAGVIQKDIAEALHKMGAIKEKISIVQGLMKMFETASSQTQGAASSFTQDLSEVTESFRAFADMFRPVH